MMRLLRALFVASCMACAASVTEDRDVDGVLGSIDCDDHDPQVGAASPEVCNGLDDDCDGLVDEGAQGVVLLFPDLDGDGYGDTSRAVVGCEQTSGLVAIAGDCDDDDALVNPGMVERCNGLDDDCDHRVDKEASDMTDWFFDYDRDGYGTASRVLTACDRPLDYSPSDADCQDYDPFVHPGAPERCNRQDDDCDGEIDEGACG